MYATIAGPPNAVTPERNKATDSADNDRRCGGYAIRARTGDVSVHTTGAVAPHPAGEGASISAP
jgi:hypothetical protein